MRFLLVFFSLLLVELIILAIGWEVLTQKLNI